MTIEQMSEQALAGHVDRAVLNAFYNDPRNAGFAMLVDDVLVDYVGEDALEGGIQRQASDLVTLRYEGIEEELRYAIKEHFYLLLEMEEQQGNPNQALLGLAISQDDNGMLLVSPTSEATAAGGLQARVEFFIRRRHAE